MTIETNFANLTEQARQYNLEALEQVFDGIFPLVFRYACFRLGSDEQAQEVCDQAFRFLLQTLDKRPQSVGDFQAWLIEVARGYIDDQLEGGLFSPDSGPRGLQPGESERQWLRRLVGKSLQRLVPEQQHLLALRFGLAWSTEETARSMRRNVIDIKSLQMDALYSLRRFLEEDS